MGFDSLELEWKRDFGWQPEMGFDSLELGVGMLDVLKVHTIIYYATSEQQGGRGKQGQSKPHTSPCLESSLCSQTDQTFLIINVIE